MSARILVVDDEEIVIRSCLRILAGDEFQVEAVQDGREALRKIEEAPYDVMILDIMMPNIDGLEVLRRVKETHPNVDVIMVTGLSQIDTAVQAMKLGAFDYISKPFEPDELKLVVQRALERRRLLQENLDLKSEVSSKYRFENIIGLSPQMQAVYRLVAQCAPTSSTVLITGESGTGKELIARAIHYNSLRKDKPFVPVDCNSLSENLLESELFGHVKGSFTGAVSNKKGMFEVAGSGTLFLDEIGNFSMSIQGKLLRVLQEREYRAVGDTRTLTANFRLITATNKDLKAMVAAGTFRDDLFYRINIFPIHAPALRERKEDIPALAYHFLESVQRGAGQEDHRYFRWRALDADQSQLAGQCARTGKRHPPGGDPDRRPRHPPGAFGQYHRRLAGAGRARGAAHRRRAQAGQESRARKVGRGDREAVRARGAQTQRLERDQERRGNRHAAPEFPGADEEIHDPRARHRARRRRGR